MEQARSSALNKIPKNHHFENFILNLTKFKFSIGHVFYGISDGYRDVKSTWFITLVTVILQPESSATIYKLIRIVTIISRLQRSYDDSYVLVFWSAYDYELRGDAYLGGLTCVPICFSVGI